MQDNKLISGGITRSLVEFTLPIIFALALQVMYGTVDLFIVGNFATIQDLSGVSTGSQLINTLTALCVGFATGSTILLGQKIGEKRNNELEGIISNSLILFLGVSIVTMVLMLLFHSNLLDILNTPSDARKQTSNYILYSSLGVPLIFGYNVLGSIFRGLGDSKTPLLAVGIACFIKIIGDLILVACFIMGSTGAAISTVIAQGISVAVSLYIVKKRGLISFNRSIKFIKINGSYIKRVIVLGLPIAIQTGLTSLSFLFITLLVNKLGVVFSAAVGITEKLTGIIMLIPLAFMQSISVFVAQNYGAKEYLRAVRGLRVGLLISATFGLITALFSFFNGSVLIWLFNRDADVIVKATEYLKIYSFDVALVPFLFCLIGYLHGCGKTMYVMIQGVLGAIAIRLCLTYYLSLIEPVTLFRIGMATPIATSVQIIMCFCFFIYTQKQIKKLI